MNHLLSQFRWQLTILTRNSLVTISIVVTLMYGIIFYFIKDLPNTDKFLTLLIFNDPVVICLFFVGISIILEKNAGILAAIFVSPIKTHTYLISKILALSVIGWCCATGMTVAMLGFDLSWVHFSTGIISTCVICSIVGIYLVSYTHEFLNFTLISIPVMFFLSLPMLNYFNLTQVPFFDLTPMYGPLQLIANGYSESTQIKSLIPEYGASLLWIAVLYAGATHIFNKRIIHGS